MSREIKFRVIVANKIFGYERLNDCGRWESMVPELNPDKGERWMPVLLDIVNSKRDQFTGLKDKSSSKEVYDGDICTATFNSKNEGVINLKGKIIMEDFMWQLETEEDYFSLNRVTIIEVIGNIYENPELID